MTFIIVKLLKPFFSLLILHYTNYNTVDGKLNYHLMKTNYTRPYAVVKGLRTIALDIVIYMYCDKTTADLIVPFEFLLMLSQFLFLF